jgi:hypothetical protein
MRSVRFRPLRAGLSAGALALLSVAAVSAETPPKVWTNEDLDRMFGPSAPSVEPRGDAETGADEWHAVEAFLERRYRWIEQEKQRDLQREQIRAAYPPREPRLTLGLVPGFGSGWWWPGPRRHAMHVPAPNERPGADETSRSAAAVNPVGRRASPSARSVNPASAR